MFALGDAAAGGDEGNGVGGHSEPVEFGLDGGGIADEDDLNVVTLGPQEGAFDDFRGGEIAAHGVDGYAAGVVGGWVGGGCH